MNVIFDWKRTLYAPDTDELMDGAIDLLTWCQTHKIPCVLIGKGDTMMLRKFNQFDLRDYFHHVVFTGTEKNPKNYAPYLHPDSIVIGDRAQSELAIGHAAGARTIWVRQGKFASEAPEGFIPTATVSNLPEAQDILSQWHIISHSAKKGAL